MYRKISPSSSLEHSTENNSMRSQYLKVDVTILNDYCERSKPSIIVDPDTEIDESRLEGCRKIRL